MNIKSQISLVALLILSNVWTPSTVYALSRTRTLPDGSYERIEREYVISNTRAVESLCDAGDAVVRTDCSAENVQQLDQSPVALRDPLFPPHEHESSVLVETTEKKDAAAAGSSCRAKVVHPQQVLKMESLVVCKKAATS